MDEDDYNQVEVRPKLPYYLPHSIRSTPVAHLFLKFNPSVMSLVEDCVRDNGYSKNLVSVIVLDAKLASACAVLIPESIKSRACSDLNGALIGKDLKLEVLPFKPGQSPNHTFNSATPKSASGVFRLTVGPRLPRYIIKQHIDEHFAIFKPEIAQVEQSLAINRSFVITFPSLSSAKEAVAAFNNSLLKGMQIKVRFEEDVSHYEQPNVSRVKALTAHSVSKEAHKVNEECTSHHGGLHLSRAEAFTPSPLTLPESREVWNIFVYSNPRFPDFVGSRELMEHFREFTPVNAYIIKKQKRSTGTGKVSFPTRDVAEKAMKAKKGTKVLDFYTISLKFEDPAHPPKSQSEKICHTYWEDGNRQSPTLPYPLSQPELPQVAQPDPPKSQRYRAWEDKGRDPVYLSPKLRKDNRHMERPSAGEPYSLSQVSPEETWQSTSQHTQNLQFSASAETISSCSLKVSHLPHSVTVKMLIVLFEKFGALDGDPVIHEGRSPYAHVNFKTKMAAASALQLNNTELEGSRIAIRSVKSPRMIPKRTHSTEYESREEVIAHHSEAIKLLPEQWNRLMIVGPAKMTLLEDMITPYKDNPNITIQPVIGDMLLQFTGKEETVQSALKYFAAQLKREIEIDR